MVDAIYNPLLATLWDADVDFANDTIKLALVTSSYTFSAAHEFLSQITNEVASGNGYTTGGNTLTVTITAGKLDAADTTWTSATFTAAAAILYKSTGTASNSDLVAFYDFGGNISPSNGTLTFAVHANGLITLS